MATAERVDTATPMLTVVVASWCDEARLRRCLASVTAQQPTLEIVVATSLLPANIARVIDAFPQVTFSYHGGANVFQLRAFGATIARGELIAIIEDHVTVSAGWATALVDAYNAGYGVLGGPIDAGESYSAFNRALYLVEYGMHMPPALSGTTRFVSGVNVAYSRRLLDETEAVWGAQFMENEVNDALRASRVEPYLVCDAIVTTDLPFTLSQATHHLFEGARHYAQYRSAHESSAKRWLRFVTSPLIVPTLLARLTARIACRQPAMLLQAMVSLPYVLVLLTAWASGERAGYSRAQHSARAVESHI